MRRASALLLAAALSMTLTACGGGAPEEDPEAVATEVPEDLEFESSAPFQVVEESEAPNEDRVATLGLLNKRNNLTQDLVMNAGESRRVGDIVVRLATCERTRPWEKVEEEGAFVQVFARDRSSPADDPVWHKIFSGWLFKNSPSLNVVEHPIYDVWVKSCEMSFPGEEESPADSASASSDANPSGSE